MHTEQTNLKAIKGGTRGNSREEKPKFDKQENMKEEKLLQFSPRKMKELKENGRHCVLTDENARN